VRRAAAHVATVMVVVAAALTVVPSAGSANECDGLQVCIPIAGPWVAVPTATGAARPQAQWQLTCPRGHIVGGLDARLSQRAIDVSFLGRMGSPVNPGITTSRSVTFLGTYVGTSPRAPSFKPYVGCMPTSGGGSRVPTSATAFEPGTPTTRRATTARVRPGNATVTAGCRAGERLVGSSHAFGFFTRTPPGASLVSSVTGGQSVRDGKVVLRVRGDAEVGAVRAVVQVQAVCARTR
jgi:hypothetical protein